MVVSVTIAWAPVVRLVLLRAPMAAPAAQPGLMALQVQLIIQPAALLMQAAGPVALALPRTLVPQHKLPQGRGLLVQQELHLRLALAEEQEVEDM